MKKLTLLVLSCICFLINHRTFSQVEPFIGEIRMVGFNYAPKGWAKCEGQLLPINQYQPLFALIGTQFGGNGTTTFALPDLRGRIPMGDGTGIGLTSRSIGENGGSETNIITVNQMPSHNHTVSAVSTEGNQNSPSGNLPADTKILDKEYSNTNGDVIMKNTMIGNTGNNQPVNNIQPFLTVNYIIALEGVFPVRN
jgi:microcystin-dependent protein